jgi:hypothetical protein
MAVRKAEYGRLLISAVLFTGMMNNNYIFDSLSFGKSIQENQIAHARFDSSTGIANNECIYSPQTQIKGC